MKQIMLRIDYDEFDQDTYRGVVLSVRDLEKPKSKRKEHRFNSGFPPLDLIDAHNFMLTDIGSENILTCCWSSSADHFTMDGDKYEWYTDDDGSEWLKASKKFQKTTEFKKLKAKLEAERSDLASTE